MNYQLSPEQKNYQRKEVSRIQTEMLVADLNEVVKRLSSPKYWLMAVGSLGLLTSCSPPVSAEGGVAAEPPAGEVSYTETFTPIPTLESTPTPIIEPTLMPESNINLLPIAPPNFDTVENLPPGSFDLVDAHAVYALYRQQQAPSMWASDTEFTTDMESYAQTLKNQGIELKQATATGQTFSLLTKGTQILLNFNPDGALKDSDPGRWSPDSTSEWIDVGAPVELFIGADGHAYIAKLDAEGNVIAYLNPIGATLDNLDSQWIPVESGQATLQWFGELGWIDATQTAQTEQGPVIVKDNKLYLFDASSEKNREVDMSEVVFSTSGEAVKICLELHRDEFENQDQMKTEFFPDGIKHGWRIYDNAVEKMVSSRFGGETFYSIPSIPIEFAQVISPISLPEYPYVGIALSKVYGYTKPLPVVLGFFDQANKFYNLAPLVSQFKYSEYDGSPDAEHMITLRQDGWDTLTRFLSRNIMLFETLGNISPEESLSYDGWALDSYENQSDQSWPWGVRESLARYHASTWGVASYEFRQSGEEYIKQTGSYIEAVYRYSTETFNTILFFPNALDYILLTP